MARTVARTFRSEQCNDHGALRWDSVERNRFRDLGLGNQLVWGYRPERDDRQLEETFRQALASGLNLIDTADSYGTGALARPQRNAARPFH